jgi:hypothetical protein
MKYRTRTYYTDVQKALDVGAMELSLHFSAELRPQSAARSSATVDKSAIGRVKPTRPHGIEDIVPRSANCWRTGRWHAS